MVGRCRAGGHTFRENQTRAGLEAPRAQALAAVRCREGGKSRADVLARGFGGAGSRRQGGRAVGGDVRRACRQQKTGLVFIPLTMFVLSVMFGL